ncbi:unnamed protein product [Clavelina lepadiformis]|uniref:Synaptonemal complex central element protein 2 n=1 Tax=Clavelina lepadiformis TaxID=159417 RepID=A0ABP0G8A3_CLALP
MSEETDKKENTEDTQMKPVPVISKEKKLIDGCGDAGAGTPVSSTHEAESGGTQDVVMKKIETLMHELEEKREADKHMVEEFRNRMKEMVDEMSQQIEQRLLLKHQETNKKVEVKLKYLTEVLQNVCALEVEINDFKNAVGVLFKEIQT